MNINDIAKEIHENAVAHGWWDDERSFPEIIALCHSEISEALEESRNNKPMLYCDNKPCPGYVDMQECYLCLSATKEYKPEGIAVELIDCVIRIFDYLAHNGIDIEAVMRAKMDYNKTRPYKHGKKF